MGKKGKRSKKSSKKVTTKNATANTAAAPATIVNEVVKQAATNNGSAPKADSGLPPGLEASLSSFTPQQQILCKLLCSPLLNQRHLFEHWPITSTNKTDKEKNQLVSQLESMDKAYPNGLVGYIKNAKDLLEKSKKGVNPLDGWKPSVPTGEAFEIGTKEFDDVESIGREELGRVGFVLVAGGLGERLGYGDIKIGLPTEMTTETKYIQMYIEYILALQNKYANTKLPLCIMTSNDTIAGTKKILTENKYFGMDESQITIVQQGEGVPALLDNDAKIALDPKSQYKIMAKPHGHGDIHSLLYTHKVAQNWADQGIDWCVFFQDTNGLAFHTLPLALGVSKKMDLVMNSLAVPRKAKQAIGGIAKLTNENSGEERTINVEYNQLDPLLRATGYPDGDVNDEKTGYSPFPGNINQLVFQLKPYAATLERTKGVMPEFVNPKYKDAEKTIFKKPTRLECMMQEFPTVLEGDMAKRVGFTSIANELCFSPVKNATDDGVALQAKGTHPGVAASGEADQYAASRIILRSIGCQVEEAEPETYRGISVVPGPAVVFKPDFCACPGDYKVRFPNPSKIKISARSTLVVQGAGVTIESLDLDGALIIECEEGATGVIKGLKVQNEGFVRIPVEASDSNEIIAMRGYRVEARETKNIMVKKGEKLSFENLESPAKSENKSKSRSAVEPEHLDLTEPGSSEKADGKQECGCVIL